MTRLLPIILVLLGGSLGALLPLADGGYLDLAQGRQVSVTGRPPPTRSSRWGSPRRQLAGWEVGSSFRSIVSAVNSVCASWPRPVWVAEPYCCYSFDQAALAS